MNYSDLQSSVANWLNRDDLTSVIPDFIMLAESEIQRILRIRQMLRNAETATDQEAVLLPSDFLELRHVTLQNQNTPLKLASLAEIDLIRKNTGRAGEPTHVAVFNNKFELAPVPDQSYELEIVYFQLIPALSTTNTSNWLLAAYPDIYLFGALSKAAPFIGEDERISVWKQEFLGGIQQLNQADERALQKGMRKSLAFRAL